MAGRPGSLLVFLRQAQPRRSPTGWALALDTAFAVGAAAVAVIEVGQRRGCSCVVIRGGEIFRYVTSDRVATGVFIAAALTGLPLAVRRVFPIASWLAIVAAIVVTSRATMPPVALGIAVFAAYSTLVHSRYRNVAIVAVAAVALGVTATFAGTLPRFPGRLTALLAIIPAMVAGLGIRELQRRLRDSAARLRRATEEHAAATQRAVEAERARIAAELHDVVTHNVSVMVVQAGAARMALASSPNEATGALLAVEASGRTAMTELRNLLGLLSPADDDVALHPQPGLGELDALVSRVAAAGLPVQLRVSGTPQPLPPGADLAAYRVVQEALTNVIRHAGRAAASVMVHWGEKLVITVSDNGRIATSAAPGRGLLGLRERLSLYGGELDAGPRPDGGWQVRAVMPVGAAA